jgi:hypothetical protein
VMGGSDASVADALEQEDAKERILKFKAA